MNRLIILSGDLAVGKSTLAKALSEKYHIPYFSKDTMKEINCDYVGFSSREENLKLSLAAVQEMIYAFHQIAISGGDLILEANFKPQEIQQLFDIAIEYNYQVSPFLLTADIPLLYSRFINRLPTRHKAHTTLHLEESQEKFASHILKEREALKELQFNVYDFTDKTLEEEIEIIANRVFKA